VIFAETSVAALS